MVTNNAENKTAKLPFLIIFFQGSNMLKDATIPDQAALRTAVAQKVLEQVRSPSLAGVRFPPTIRFPRFRVVAV